MKNFKIVLCAVIIFSTFKWLMLFNTSTIITTETEFWWFIVASLSLLILIITIIIGKNRKQDERSKVAN
jgi:nitrogen fixation/metabolism regulation signal transduction histidine kinase